MSNKVIDYFATVGRPNGPLQCKMFPMEIEEDGDKLSAPEIWQEAITDIILLSDEETVPDEESWTFLTRSIGDDIVDQPYLAFRKRKFSGRLDHITQLKFIAPGENIPPGFELIRSSSSGKLSGYVKPFGFLAFKRAKMNQETLLYGDPIISDIIVVKKGNGEEFLEHYLPIEKHGSSNKGILSSDIIYAYRSLPSMGLCNLELESICIDRYPIMDIKGLPLPELALPVFAFPRKLKLEIPTSSNFPMPTFYTFVFTDQDGRHMYVACLKFFEKILCEDVITFAKSVYGDSLDFSFLFDRGIYCPKVICVLSHFPFYRAMRRYLRHLYSLSLSSSVQPLENFITSVVSQIPLPVEGGRPFHLILDAGLISMNSKPLTPIEFKLPNLDFYPIMDLDFAGPMRCLSIDHMLAVFVLMLREAKILFLSCSNTMLTETMETLRLLLFPLSWASCFVSRLPEPLIGLLQAPGGFMLGLHMDLADLFNDASSNINKSRDEVADAMKKYILHMQYRYPLVAGTYIVDLTSNTIFQYDGKGIDNLQPPQIENINKVIPAGPKLRIKAKLQAIAEEYEIAPQTIGLEEFDSAFDLKTSNDEKLSSKKWEEFPTLVIRDSFMSLMADLLGDYAKYIKPPIEDLSADTFRTFKEEFFVNEYLKDAGDSSTKQLLEFLMETQMFSVLLQIRTEETAQSIMFFEHAANLQRELGLSVGGHGSHHLKSGGSVTELPVCLYSLTQAEVQWACLSKTMQQHVLNQSIESDEDNPLKPKQYKIRFISHGTLSPIRQITHQPVVSYSSHPITNQALFDLLKYIDFINVTENRDAHSAFTAPGFSSVRRELDRNEELHLDNVEYGPLIIPGPTLNGKIEIEGEKDEMEKFTYPKGWPDLNKELFNQTSQCIHWRISNLQTERLVALSKISKKMRLLVRSPAERLSRNISKGTEKLKISPSLSPVITSLLDITHVSITLLSLRATTLFNPLNDIFESLGIIAQIEHWGLQNLLNETVWRSIFMACSEVGGDVVRRIALVLYEYIINLNGKIDALTYGQYTKVIKAKKSTSEKVLNEISYLDQYFYLEEMGNAWYLLKSKHQPSYASNPIRSASSDQPDLSTSSKASSKKKATFPPPPPDATELVARQLILQKPETFSPFCKSRQSVASMFPLKAELFDSHGSFSEIMDTLHHHRKELHELAKVDPEIESKSSRSRTSSRASFSSHERRTSFEYLSGTPERMTQAISSMSSELNNRSPFKLITKFSSQFTSFTNKTNSTSQSPVPSNLSPKGAGGWNRFLTGKIFQEQPKIDNHEKKPESLAPLTPINLTSNDEKKTPGKSQPTRNLEDSPLEKLSSTLNFEDDASDEEDEEEGDDDENENESEDKDEDIVKDKKFEPKIPQSDHENEVIPVIANDEIKTEVIVDLENKIDSLTISDHLEVSKPGLELSVLQDRLLDAFTQKIAKDKKAISIQSNATCSCGFSPMDEEILSLWCQSTLTDVHKQHGKKAFKDHENKGVTCPSCSNEIFPELTISCYRLNEANELVCDWKEVVIYLSPFVVRFEFEENLLKVGSMVRDAIWLHKHSPALYWNIIWYTSRLNLPSGFSFESLESSQTIAIDPNFLRKDYNIRQVHSHAMLTDYHNLLCPVIIGVHDSVIKAKILRMFEGLPGNYLDLRDLFPMCSNDEFKIVTDHILVNLDGSPVGLREAMLRLVSIDSFIAPVRGNSLRTSRLIYTYLFLLSVHFARYNLFDRLKTGFSRDFEKENVYNKIFYDCVKCVMSRIDFERCGVEEEDLIKSMKVPGANIVRAVYGVLP